MIRSLPRTFFVLCWHCRARIYLSFDPSPPKIGTELRCPTCGAMFAIGAGEAVYHGEAGDV